MPSASGAGWPCGGPLAHVQSQPEAAHAACGSKEGSERGRREVGRRGERREGRGRKRGEVKRWKKGDEFEGGGGKERGRDKEERRRGE